VLIGEAKERLAAAVGSVLPVVTAVSMEDAVHQARHLAQPGDAVLLSPACSSFDMFSGYAERGRVFAAAVQGLGASAE
jgi:UDP-N-acetylmuramoylalanine--D-glutamate ligase